MRCSFPRTVIERIFGCQDCKFADKHQLSVHFSHQCQVIRKCTMDGIWPSPPLRRTAELHKSKNVKILKEKRKDVQAEFSNNTFALFITALNCIQSTKISMKQKKRVNQQIWQILYRSFQNGQKKEVSSFFFYHSLNMDGGRLLS